MAGTVVEYVTHPEGAQYQLPELDWMHEENDPDYVPPREPTLREKIAPWVSIVRPRILATAPGDPLSGIAFGAVAGYTDVSAARIAGALVATVLLCAAGCVDNDIIDHHRDKRSERRRLRAGLARPIARKQISLFQARVLRLALVLAAALFGWMCGMPQRWWGYFAGLCFAVLMYNRWKDYYTDYGMALLGCCRALAAASGAVMAFPAIPSDLENCQIGFFMSGTGLYAAAVAYLGLDKEYARFGLPYARYFWPLGLFLPYVAFLRMDDFPVAAVAIFLAGGLAAWWVWIASVKLLRRQHRLSMRQRAIDSALFAFPVMQCAWIIAPLTPGWFVAAVLLAIFAAAATNFPRLFDLR